MISSVALSLTEIGGTLSPLYFVIKRYEQTFHPGLCLSDSRMTIVHILTVGISLLDPYCLPCVEIRPLIVAIGEPFYGHCPKSRNIKLNFLGWITSSVLSSGHFSYWAILISPVVLSTLCFDAVFTIDIIIMVYSTLIISCSPSFVKGGICISPPICFVRTHHWLWSALVMILTSAGAVTRVCTERGL